MRLSVQRPQSETSYFVGAIVKNVDSKNVTSRLGLVEKLKSRFFCFGSKRQNPSDDNYLYLDVERLEDRMMLNGDIGEVIFAADFEDAQVEPGGFAFVQMVSGLQATGSPVEIQNNHPSVGPASQGRKHLELDGDNGIYVDIDASSTANLMLRFDYSARPGVSPEQNAIEVHWDGQLIETVSADGQRNRSTKFREFDLNLDGGQGRLEFRSANPGAVQGLGGLLDNIRVNRIVGPIQLTEIPDQTISVGSEFNVQASLLPPDENLPGAVYRLVEGPPGMQIDPNTGEISWTSSQENVDLADSQNDSTVPGEPVLVFQSGFEDIDVAVGGYAFAPSVSGFTATGPPVEIQHNHPSVGPASEGQQHLELDQLNGISRLVETVIGDEYELVIDYSPRPGVGTTGNTIEIWWDGNLLDSISKNGKNRRTQFSEYRFDLSEFTDSTTQLEFRSNDPTDQFGLGGLLDNIRLYRKSETIIDGPDGKYDVVVEVTDNQGRTDRESFTICIDDSVDNAPVIVPVADQTIAEGQTLELPIVATGESNRTLTYTLANEADSPASIDPSTGLFTFTTDEVDGPGVFEFEVSVSDGELASSETFRVIVGEVNLAPEIIIPDEVSARSTTVEQSEVLTLTFDATDPDIPANVLTYALESPVSGAQIDPDTGVFTFIPTTAMTGETFDFNVILSDNGSPELTDSHAFSVEVTSCAFHDDLANWTVTENGGTDSEAGSVTAEDCEATITEGDSFNVTLERSFIVQQNKAIQFTYSDLNFDTTDPAFINDAFEVALLGPNGESMIDTFAVGRDAFFNISEGLPAVTGDGVQVDGNTVTVGLNGLAVGTEATLIFRLVNDDSDTATKVKLTDFQIIDSFAEASRRSIEALMFSTTDSTSPSLTTTSQGPDNRLDLPVVVTGGNIFVAPEIGEAQPLTPSVEWSVSEFEVLPAYDQVMMAPAVIDINQDGTPDIIFSTFTSNNYNEDGVLRVISGADGSPIWSLDDPAFRVGGSAGVAVGDIDNDGFQEIVVRHESNGYLAVEHDGTVKWLSDNVQIDGSWIRWGSAALADLDHDGQTEIVVGSTVLDNQGNILWIGEEGFAYGLSAVADLDGDGDPEIVTGTTAYRANGDIYWDLEAPLRDDGFTFAGLPAIGNFDNDTLPEIAIVIGDHLELREHDGTLIWKSAVPGEGGGAPTIADFDGDGKPEIGVAGARYYVVFEGDGSLKWFSPTQDFSSERTGSSVFDFDSDGRAEVIYGDEISLRIYDGETGQIKYNLLKSSGTTFELPVIVDVDGDGVAEIVAIANDYVRRGAQKGIFVIGDDDNWSTTRQIWNQHTYHVTNINDDGSIPAYELNSWELYNNYRRNQQPTGTQLGEPLITARAPRGGMPAGNQTMLTGEAIAQGIQSTGQPNQIIAVTVNGVPVDQLDVTGKFFVAVDLLPGENGFTFEATDIAGQTTQALLTVVGTQIDSEIDFNQFADITQTIDSVYSRTSFDELNTTLFVDIVAANAGNFPADGPLLVGVKNISDPSVSLLDIDGATPDGMPYFDITHLLTGDSLESGNQSETATIGFFNPLEVQFDYDLVFLAQTNAPPEIVSLPVIEAYYDQQYTYDVDATDVNEDVLVYALTIASTGMTIDAATGEISWSPTINDYGLHDIEVEVTDGRGGKAEQRFTITVTEAPPNRPPIIVSTPVTSAVLPAQVEVPVFPFDEMVLNGNAELAESQDGEVIRLTPAVRSQAGSAFSQTLRNASDFSAGFTFRISESGGPGGLGGNPQGADGLAFIIQSVSNSVGGSGGGLGYGGIENSVAVEFDTFHNPNVNDTSWDPSSNHIGININGVAQHNNEFVVTIDEPFDNEELWYAWVDYDGFNLEVRLSQNNVRPNEPTLSRTLDIPTIIDSQEAYFGFASGTGATWSNHDLVQWRFNNEYLPFDNNKIGDFEIEWQTEAINVSNSTEISDGKTPTIAIDQDGLLHVAYRDAHWQSGWHENLMYTSMEIDGTVRLVPVNLDPPGYSGAPTLVIDESNRPVVAWHAWDVAPGEEVLLTTLDGNGLPTGFVQVTDTPDRTNTDIPQLVFGNEGELFLVWQDENNDPVDGDENRRRDLFFQKLKFESTGYVVDGSPVEFTSEEGLGAGNVGYVNNFGNFAVDSQNRVHAIWADWRNSTDFNQTEIFYEVLDNNGATVLDERAVSSNNDFPAIQPQLQIDTNDNAHILWIENRTDTDALVHTVMAPDGTAVSTRDLIVGEPETVSSFSFSVDEFNQLHVVSSNATSDNDILFYHRFDQNGDLLIDGLQITETDAKARLNPTYPSIVASGKDTFSVVWEEKSDTGIEDVFFKSFTVRSTAVVTYQYDVQAIDVDDDSLIYALSEAPTGMTINPQTGKIRWAPSTNGPSGQLSVLVDELSDANGVAVVGDMLYFGQLVDGGSIFSLDISKPDAEAQTVATGFQVAELAAKGNELFIATNTEIFRLDLTTPNATPTTYLTGLDFPVGMTFDGDDMYFSEYFAGEISTVDTTTAFPIVESVFSGLAGPHGLAKIGDDLFFVQASQGAQFGTLSKIHLAVGAPTPELIVNGLEAPNDILLHDGFLYVTEGGSGSSIAKIDVSGTTPVVTRLSLGDRNPNRIATNGTDFFLSNYQGLNLDGQILRYSESLFNEVTEFDVTVKVTDGNGGVAEQSYVACVHPDNAGEVTIMASSPIITSVPGTKVDAGQAWEYQLAAQDAEGGPVNFAIGIAPSGVTLQNIEIENANGEIESVSVVRWDVPENLAGRERLIEVIATDAEGNSRKQLVDLKIGEPDGFTSVPVIVSTPPTAIRAGQTWSYQLQAIEVNGDPLNYSLTQSPADMTISKTGLLVWNAPEEPASTTVEVTVDDGREGQTTQTFILVFVSQFVNDGPTITSVPRVSATAGEVFAYDAIAFDLNGDSLTWKLETAPVGVSVNEKTGQVRWVANSEQLGSHFVVLSVTDEQGETARQRFQIHVGCNNLAPAIVSVPPTVGLTQRDYVYAVKAKDVEGGKLTWSLDSAPEGMSIDAERGFIRWQPAIGQIGPHDVVIFVSDGTSTAKQTYTVVVSSADDLIDPNDPTKGTKGNRAPLITSTPRRGAVVDSLYQYQVEAIDLDGHDISYALVGTAPDGMTVNADGLLNWTPAAADAGNVAVNVQAIDEFGAIASQGFFLKVSSNSAPVIESSPPKSVVEGQTYRYAINAVDADDDELVFELVDGPEGVTIDSQIGYVAWSTFGNSVAAGTNYSAAVKVTDTFGNETVQTWQIEVIEDTVAPNVSIAVISPEGVFFGDSAKFNIGKPYRVQVLARDNARVTDLELILDGVDVPLDERGIATIDPSQSGQFELIATATDSAGLTGEKTTTVILLNQAPEIISDPPAFSAANEDFVYSVVAADAEEHEFSFSITSGPSGATIDPLSGDVSIAAADFAPGVYELVVRATDEFGAFSEQTSQLNAIDLSINHAPIFLTEPVTDIPAGYFFFYQPETLDYNGDTVTYSLIEGAAEFKEETGRTRFRTPFTPQELDFVLQADDGNGGITTQSFTVNVTPANRAPVFISQPTVRVKAGELYAYAPVVNDPNGDDFDIYFANGPRERKEGDYFSSWAMDIDADNVIRWQTDLDDVGSHYVRLWARDEWGEGGYQSFTLEVVEDLTSPLVEVLATPNPAEVGDVIAVQVFAEDDGTVEELTLTLDGQPIALDAEGKGTITATETGNFEFLATATDDEGNTTQRVVPFQVRDLSDMEAPVVSITSPTSGTAITSFADVVGSVSDVNLDFYSLNYRPLSGGSFVEFLRNDQTVEDGVLGEFDPTTLSNDSYVIRLYARDVNGKDAFVDTVVDVMGELKLGNFTLSFTDMTIPVGGVPIVVGRTYDSLNASQQGEFGYGWRMEFRDVDLRTSVAPSGTEDLGFYRPFKDGSRVYLTLPGGKREGFTFNVERAGGLRGGLGIHYGTFEADPGVKTQLAVKQFELAFDSDANVYTWGSGQAYNPANSIFGGKYYATTEEGVLFEIDGDTGNLERIIDTNANVITFSDEAIVSSSGQRVDFVRDDQGRIVQAIDPEGNAIEYKYDDQGDLISVTDREGNVTQFNYNAPRPHYLSEIIDPLGRTGIRTEYDETGKLVRMFDVNGNMTELIHDPDNFIEQIVDPLGNTTTFEYDQRGNVLREVDALGGETSYSYDVENNELTVTDALGNTTEMTYSSTSDLLTTTDPLGNITTKAYDRIQPRISLGSGLSFSGFLKPFSVETSTTNAVGDATTMGYDSQGNLISMANAAGETNEFMFDGSGMPTSVSRAGTTPQTFAYDDLENLVESVDSQGNRTTVTYDRNGEILTETVLRTLADGAIVTTVTENEYDNEGRVRFVRYYEDGVALTENESRYDATGRRIEQIDTLGQSTKYFYDERGLLIETIYPDATPLDDTDNPRTKTEYDEFGQSTARIDELGIRTEYVYDALGRLVTTILPDATPADLSDNPRRETEYDNAGRAIAQIDELGNRTETVYDAAGRAIFVVLPDETPGDATDNPRIETVYNEAGQQVEQVDPLGNRTRFEYEDGRPVRTFYADGTSTENIYNDIGIVVASIDQNGIRTDYEHDEQGQLLAVISEEVVNPETGLSERPRTEYEYDQRGNLLVQRDALGKETTYVYDARGRKISSTLPLGQTSTTTYDVIGRQNDATDFNGNVIEYLYDERNRVLSKTFADGTTVSTSYGDSGLVESTTDSRGVTTYTYDERGRITLQANPDSTSLAYTYDAANNRASITVPSGTTLYTYDARNRIKTTTAPNGDVTSYTYNALSLTGTTFANGTAEARTYDALNRLTHLENSGPNGTINSFTYELDGAGNRLAAFESDGRRVDYEYDGLYRLTSEIISDPANGNRTIDYVYDIVGNRLERDDSVAGLTSYVYDLNYRLVEETTGSSVSAYVYDANGNTLTKSANSVLVTQFVWNLENRLVAVDTSGDGTIDITNEYDASGIRVSQTENGAKTNFLVDSARQVPQVVEEYAEVGVIKVSYDYGRDLISQNQPSETGKSFHLVDGLRSTRILTDANGAVTDRYIYDAFGRTVAQTGSTSNAYLFAGEQRDLATGLDYLRARYLNPATGRFVSRDPYPSDPNRPLTANRYSYVENNAVNLTDPTGYFSISEQAATLGVFSALNALAGGGALFGDYINNRSPMISDILILDVSTATHTGSIFLVASESGVVATGGEKAFVAGAMFGLGRGLSAGINFNQNSNAISIGSGKVVTPALFTKSPMKLRAAFSGMTAIGSVGFNAGAGPGVSLGLGFGSIGLSFVDTSGFSFNASNNFALNASASGILGVTIAPVARPCSDTFGACGVVNGPTFLNALPGGVIFSVLGWIFD